MAEGTVKVDRGVERPKQRALLWLGIGVVAVGILAIVFAVQTTVLTVAVLGALMIVGGALEISVALSSTQERFWLQFLSGILSVVVGAFLLMRPALGVIAVGLLIALNFLASGVFRIVGAIFTRYDAWGADLAYGILVGFLGFVVLRGWPVSSLWILAALVGSDLIGRGLAMIGVSRVPMSVGGRRYAAP